MKKIVVCFAILVMLCLVVGCKGSSLLPDIISGTQNPPVIPEEPEEPSVEEPSVEEVPEEPQIPQEPEESPEILTLENAVWEIKTFYKSLTDNTQHYPIVMIPGDKDNDGVEEKVLMHLYKIYSDGVVYRIMYNELIDEGEITGEVEKLIDTGNYPFDTYLLIYSDDYEINGDAIIETDPIEDLVSHTYKIENDKLIETSEIEGEEPYQFIETSVCIRDICVQDVLDNLVVPHEESN